MAATTSGLLFCSILLLLNGVSSKTTMKQTVKQLKLAVGNLKIDSDTFRYEIDELQESLNSSVCLCGEDIEDQSSKRRDATETKEGSGVEMPLQPIGFGKNRFNVLSNGIVEIKRSMKKELHDFSVMMNVSHQQLNDKIGTVETTLQPLKEQVDEVSNQIKTLEEGTNHKLDDKLEMVDLAEILQPMKQQLNELADQLTSFENKTEHKFKIMEDQLKNLENQVIRNTKIARDCKDIMTYTGQRSSGVYNITLPVSGDTVTVYCDMETAGGGWTVLQRRFDGSESFGRWSRAYEHGFGNIENGEFWLGLKTTHELTNGTKSELRIDLEDAVGIKVYETFSNFYLTSGPDYVLNIDKGVGTAGDERGLSYSNNFPFSTYDRASRKYGQCGVSTMAGWWWHTSTRSNCAYASLNSEYVTPGYESNHFYAERPHLTYYDFRKLSSLKATKMMFRRME